MAHQGELGQAGSLWHLPEEQPIGVLVGPALPRNVRIAKQNRYAGRPGEGLVVGHQKTLLLCHGAHQLSRQGLDRLFDGTLRGLGAVVMAEEA